jgi:hypothetical protein
MKRRVMLLLFACKYYSPQDWEKLSFVRRKQILEQRKVTPRPPRSQRANSAPTTTTQSLSNEAPAGVAPIPATVIANQAQVAQSVVSSNSAPTVISGSAVPVSTIRSMLSNAVHSRRDDDSVIVQEGKVYLCFKMANVHYQFHVDSAAQTACAGSLVDGGANGGLCGSDLLILSETGQRCNVTGITNNAVTDLTIVQADDLIQSSIGPIIGIFHQYASIGNGKSVHSFAQLRSFGTLIDDVPLACGGT